MRDITPATNFIHTLMQSPPDASAWIAGGNNFPSISGLARFYATEYEGTLVEVEVFGLPNVAAPGSSNFYGMHIHENGVCVSPFTSSFTGCRITLQRSPRATPANGLPAV